MSCLNFSATQRHNRILCDIEIAIDQNSGPVARQLAYEELGFFVTKQERALAKHPQRKSCSLLNDARNARRHFEITVASAKKPVLRSPMTPAFRPQRPSDGVRVFQESERPGLWDVPNYAPLGFGDPYAHRSACAPVGLAPAPRPRRIRSASQPLSSQIPERISSRQPQTCDVPSIGRHRASRELEALAIEARFSLTDFLAAYRSSSGHASRSLLSYDRAPSTLMMRDHNLGSRPSTRASMLFSTDTHDPLGDGASTHCHSLFGRLESPLGSPDVHQAEGAGLQRRNTFGANPLLCDAADELRPISPLVPQQQDGVGVTSVAAPRSQFRRAHSHGHLLG